MKSALLCAALASAADWSQWRGPNRDAVAASMILKWPEQLPAAKWKIEVGEGHSSPIFGAGRVYSFARLGDQETVRALDPATGKDLWRQSYNAPYQVNQAASAHGKGPKSTPVFADGRLYTLGINGLLACWDAASGKQLWKHDFATAPVFGTAMSPMVHQGMLIAHGGGDGKGSLIAFDAKTGAVHWTWKDDGPAYSSPVVTTVSGVEHLITQSQKHLIGLNARTGALLWKVPFTTAYEQNSVTPVVRGDLVIYSGLENGVTAARITATGLVMVWQNKSVSMYMNSPVWKGDTLCGLSHKNKGQYFCLNTSNGQNVWTSPGRQGENAALILTSDGMLSLDTEGSLQLIAVGGKEFQVLRKYTAATSATWAHPGIGPAGILIKDFKTLAYYAW